MSSLIRKLCLAVVVVGTVLPLVAQQGRGVIFGTVTDPSGAPIVGASVQIKEVDTGTVTNVVSGSQGDYVSPGVAPGNYTVTVDQTGFKSLIRSGLVVQ